MNSGVMAILSKKAIRSTRDKATVRSIYTMTMRIPGDQPTYMQASGWYNDTIVRTSEGWRIQNRFEQLAYVKPA